MPDRVQGRNRAQAQFIFRPRCPWYRNSWRIMAGLRECEYSLLSVSGFNDVTVTNGAVLVPSTSLNFRNLLVASNSFSDGSSQTPRLIGVELEWHCHCSSELGESLLTAADIREHKSDRAPAPVFPRMAVLLEPAAAMEATLCASAGNGPGGVSYGSITPTDPVWQQQRTW